VTPAKLVVLACVAVWADVVGCANDREAPDDTNASGDVEAPTATAFREQYCALIDPCCSAAGFGACGPVVNEATSQGTYDARAGSDCIRKLGEHREDPDFCESLSVHMLSSVSLQNGFCGPVFRTPGNVAPGGACDWDADCRPDSRGVATCLVGMCTVVVDGNPGDACVGTVRDGLYLSDSAPGPAVICDHGKSLYCDDTAHVCVTRNTELGTPCESLFDCTGSQYCNAERICAARVASGATCAKIFGECEGGVYCSDSLRCELPGTLPGGAACENVVGAPPECASEYCTDGTCESPLLWLCAPR
jgi:hypothetical protein